MQYDNLRVATIDDIRDKSVLLLVDYNVPLIETLKIETIEEKIETREEKEEEIEEIEETIEKIEIEEKITSYIVADDFRLQSTRESINLAKNAKNLILLSHLARPNKNQIDRFKKSGFVEPDMSLRCVFNYLKNQKYFTDDNSFFVTDLNDIKKIQSSTKQSIILLENSRLYDQLDLKNNLKVDIVIYDSFSCAHRQPLQLDNVPYLIGPLVKKELQQIKSFWNLVIMGGKKIQDKKRLIKSLKRGKIFIASQMALEIVRQNKDVIENISEDDRIEMPRMAEYLQDCRRISFQCSDEEILTHSQNSQNVQNQSQ
ncbi:3-phosphoglycerate kinase, partial [Pseudoloma neurophilia]